jgi:rubrerythrin
VKPGCSRKTIYREPRLSLVRWPVMIGKMAFIDILQNAVEMEQEGKGFFERASNMMRHERAKQMFTSLVKQEQRHIDILGEELGRLQAGIGWATLEEMKLGAQHYPKISVFKDKEILNLKLRPDAGELEVINVGIQVEKKSIDYYRDAAQRAEDLKAQEVFNWLVGEEAGHLTILNAEYDNRSGAGFYYDNMEFSLEVE